VSIPFTDRNAERTREAAGWAIAVVGGFGVTAVLSITGTPRQYFAGAWYMLVIAVASLVGGWKAGALAVTATAAGLLWAVLPPRRNLAVENAGEVAALLAFLCAAVVLVLLVRSRDRATRLATDRALRIERLAQLVEALARADGVDAVVRASLDWCRDSLGATRSLLTVSADDGGRGTREEWWSTGSPVDDELRRRVDELFHHDDAIVERTGVVAARLSDPEGPSGVLVVDLGTDRPLDAEDEETLAVAAGTIAHAVAKTWPGPPEGPPPG
jgi:K+-sensing histidine kinase KdpD